MQQKVDDESDVVLWQPVVEMEDESVQGVLDEGPDEDTDTEQEDGEEVVLVLPGDGEVVDDDWQPDDWDQPPWGQRKWL